MAIYIIDGPNLNLTGIREPSIYGRTTPEQSIESIRAALPDETFHYFQSNHEGEIIDALHKYGFSADCTGIVINPGAFAHYSIAIADAIRAVPAKVVEVHISNVFAREGYRRNMVTAEAADCVISGAGMTGYLLAAEYLISAHHRANSNHSEPA